MAGFIENLYQKYAEEINRYLLSLTKNYHIAEDITQETFFRAYIFLHNEQIENEKAWLYKVANNTYIDYLRKDKRLVDRTQDFFYEIKANNRSIEEQYELSEEVNGVIVLLDKLPHQQKQAVLLADFHDFSYKESAEILNVTTNYFKLLLFRARQKLRNHRRMENERE